MKKGNVSNFTILQPSVAEIRTLLPSPDKIAAILHEFGGADPI